MKIHFFIMVELPAATAAERVELLRDEIQQHAAAVVPFYTHQTPVLVTCEDADKALAEYRRRQLQSEFAE
jgi:hypothetical protein